MDEEIKEEKREEKPKPEDSGDRSKPETAPLIKSANDAADRLEKANEVKEELLEREEELAALTRMNGKSEAGTAPKPKETEDEKYIKDAKERYAGTGMDPTPDNTETTYG